MEMKKIVLAVVMILALCQAAFADGILLPMEDPKTDIYHPEELFAVKYHHVDVAIDNKLCRTKIDQVFINDSDYDREGTYIFPVPEGASISKFSMFAGENEIVGKVLDRDEAHRIYQQIVSQRKDPALLEYIDSKTFKASVYPIPANGEKRIRLDYTEVIRKTGNVYCYVYPLATERFSSRPLEDARVTVNITSDKPISNVYSPTHNVEVANSTEKKNGKTVYVATVGWQAKNTLPDTDLVLYYTLAEEDVAVDLITYTPEGEDGFFVFLASANADVNKDVVKPKNVVFVLDRTGSMSGEKIVQAKGALKFCVNSLGKNDRFNLITFNETPSLLFDSLEKADNENKSEATRLVKSLDATGGTNINDTLIMAMDQFKNNGNKNNYIIFLTDGLPTVGEKDVPSIVKNVGKANNNSVKVFSFGVGYDVNTHLLDKMSTENKGATEYVRPNEDIEVKVSGFFAKVSDPVLSDCNLEVVGAEIYDVYPKADNLPDLFAGSQIIAIGRYKNGGGKATIQLSGYGIDGEKTYKQKTTLNGDTVNDFIPQLWAARKIGYLMDEIRLESNQELVDEVVRLSKKYGIPTEYTSFLADDRKYLADEDMAVEMAREKAKKASEVEEGEYGVAQSSNSSQMKGQAQAPSSTASQAADMDDVQVVGAPSPNKRAGYAYRDSNDNMVIVANVQHIEGKTFYQRGDFWEDPEVTDETRFMQIKIYSDAHFDLMKRMPLVAKYSQLGNVRFVLDNGQAIEIGPEGEGKLTDDDKKKIGKEKAAVPYTALAIGVLGTLVALGVRKGVRK